MSAAGRGEGLAGLVAKHDPQHYCPQGPVSGTNGTYTIAFLGCSCGWNSDGEASKTEKWSEHVVAALEAAAPPSTAHVEYTTTDAQAYTLEDWRKAYEAERQEKLNWMRYAKQCATAPSATNSVAQPATGTISDTGMSDATTWRTVIVGLPILRKLLAGQNVELSTLLVSLIPDDVLWNARAALATPSPQAPTCICKRVLDCPVHGEQSNAFSTTSAREQSAATAAGNLSVAELAEHITYKIQSLLTDKYTNSFKIASGVIEQELRKAGL